MTTRSDKRRAQAERKVKSAMNNSRSKALYSFSRAQRFSNDQKFLNNKCRSLTDVHFCDLRSKLYDKKIGFSSSKRSEFWAKNKNPGPNQYTPSFQLLEKQSKIQFKCGRNECKTQSPFKVNTNPGPGQYQTNYNNKFKNLYYSLAKRTQLKSAGQNQSPGPIYTIQSTMLDKNKYLSIYIRRNSTKICPSKTSFARKQKDNTLPLFNKIKQISQNAILTYKGNRRVGYEGPFAISTHGKRQFQKTLENGRPGPGYYQSFSEFIDQDEVLI